MGNSLQSNSTQIGIGIGLGLFAVLIISGFIVIINYFIPKDDKNQKKNADEDRQCIMTTSGKVKNNN